jgi:hypothetical protein
MIRPPIVMIGLAAAVLVVHVKADMLDRGASREFKAFSVGVGICWEPLDVLEWSIECSARAVSVPEFDCSSPSCMDDDPAGSASMTCPSRPYINRSSCCWACVWYV